jgi:hypothetical protein
MLLFVAPVQAQVTPGEVEKSVKQAETDRRQQEEQTARRARLLQGLLTTIANADEVLRRLQERLEKDMPRFDALKTSDDGKRLATDPHFVRDFIARAEETRLTPAQLKDKQSALAQIQKAVQSEAEKPNVGFLPDRKLVDEVEEVSKWASTHLALVNRDLSWIDTAIAKAPQDTDLKTAKSLQVAIRDELARQEALLMEAKRAAEDGARNAAAATMSERAKELETLRQQQKIEGMLRASQTEIQMMRLQNEFELKRRDLEERELRARREREFEDRIAALNRELSEAKAVRAKNDAVAAAKVQDIDNETDAVRKETLFKSPEVAARIKKTLQPFTTVGYVQPNLAPEECITKGRVSLTALRAVGALDKSLSGYDTLMRIGGSGGGGMSNGYKHDDKRPKWVLHDMHYGFAELKSDDKDYVIQAQQDLLDFGDIMVKQGMLAE